MIQSSTSDDIYKYRDTSGNTFETPTWNDMVEHLKRQTWIVLWVDAGGSEYDPESDTGIDDIDVRGNQILSGYDEEDKEYPADADVIRINESSDWM